MTPDAPRIMQAVERTWRPARMWDVGPVRMRAGQGGGQRVSSATTTGPVSEAELQAAEAAFRDAGERPLFQCRDDVPDLANLLDRHGYVGRDKTIMYVLPIEHLTDIPIPRVTAFTIWEPLAIMNEIWATDDIGPERLAVMHRAPVKTAVLARWNEKPAGAAFVATDEEIAMVHGLVVLPHQRRQGVAEWMMRRASLWAQTQGAKWMSVLCVADNAPANALYQALGFEAVGSYHYRVAPS